MKVTPLPVHAALKGTLESRLYHPDDPERTTEQGLELLRRVALDAPVYIVTLERGWPRHQLRRVDHRELRTGGLLPDRTAYATAFRTEGRTCLVVVAVSALRVPAARAPRATPAPAVPAPPVRKRKTRR